MQSLSYAGNNVQPLDGINVANAPRSRLIRLHTPYYRHPGGESEEDEDEDVDLENPYPAQEEDDSDNDGMMEEGSSEDVLELGNLPLRDDTDDVIYQAVNAAKIDNRYAQDAGRFADLYHQSMQELHKIEGPVSISSAESRAAEKDISSFGRRVMEKMQDAEDAGRFNHGRHSKHLVPDCGHEEEGRHSPGSYFRPRDEMPDEVEEPKKVRPSSLLIDTTVSPASSDASSEISALSLISNDGSGSISTNDTSAVTSPSSVEGPAFEMPPLIPARSSQDRQASRPRSQSTSTPASHLPGVQPRPRTTSMAAKMDVHKPFAHSGETSSVRAKIRQFEQKVHAEGMLDASGPL